MFGVHAAGEGVLIAIAAEATSPRACASFYSFILRGIVRNQKLPRMCEIEYCSGYWNST